MKDDILIILAAIALILMFLGYVFLSGIICLIIFVMDIVLIIKNYRNGKHN